MVVKCMQMTVSGILEAVESNKLRVLVGIIVNMAIYPCLIWLLAFLLNYQSSGLLYSVIITNTLIIIAYVPQVSMINWHEQSTIRVQHLNHELIINRF
jgi:Na+-driven multidrug efflux pump